MGDGSAVYLYADYAKIFKSLKSKDDEKCLQKVISKIKEWCENGF